MESPETLHPSHTRLSITSPSKIDLTSPLANVYNRSLGHPSSLKIDLTSVKKSGYGFAAKSGNIINIPPKFKTKRRIKKKALKKPPGLFYDEYLLYRTSICQYILKHINPQITKNADNKYPCVLFLAPSAPKEEDLPKKYNHATATKHWAQITACYFLAITNHIAWREGIPIEIVFKSTFSNLIPSISVCGPSIRISVGFIPTQYAKVIAKAVNKLYAMINQSFIQSLKQTTLPKSYIDIQCAYKQPKYPDRFRHALKSVSVWDWLWSSVDKGNRTGIYQLQRKQCTSEALVNKVYHILHTAYERHTQPRSADLTAPIKRFPFFFQLNNRKLSLRLPKSWLKNQRFDHHIKGEKKLGSPKFWALARSLAQRLNANVKEFEKLFIQKKSCNKFYRFLESAHHDFCAQVECLNPKEESFASDSEDEFEYLGENWHCKKLVVFNGIRATNLARRTTEIHARKALSYKDFDMNQTYYEIPDAFKFVTFTGKIPDKDNPNETYKAKVYDINAANVFHTIQIPFQKKMYNAIILDNTSSTTTQTQVYLRKAFKCAPIVMLVNSGIKNETGGSAVNAYGTLRIFVKNKIELDKIYTYLTANEHASHINLSHARRRAYKTRGFVPQMQDLIPKGKKQ